MYLARFEFTGEQWLQGILRLSFCEASISGTQWSRLLAHIVSALPSAPHLRFGYRLSLTSADLNRTIFVMAKADHENQLRRCLASFMRLNILAEDSIQVSRQRQEHDDWIKVFPRYRCLVVPPTYTLPSNLWISCNFSARPPLLSRLLAEAAALGYQLGYHANFEPITVDSLIRREARRNALHVGSIAGVPPSLAAYQEDLARRLETARYLTDELFGVESLEAAEWLGGALRRHFGEAYSEMRIEAPEFSFNEDAHELLLLATRQSSAFEEPSVQEICSTCLEEPGIVDLLGWCPAADDYKGLMSLHSLQGRRASPAGVEELSESEWPTDCEIPAPQGSSDYVFVSYKRRDILRIAPLLRKLVEWGYRVWYDREIPGGSDWDEVIEDHLERCNLLIVFLSQEAVSSRYVRREVKYADALNKTIVPVQLEAVELLHGMSMLISERQIVDCSSAEGINRLKQALDYWLKQQSPSNAGESAHSAG